MSQSLNLVSVLNFSPLSIKDALNLVSELSSSDLTASSLEEYSWCEVRNNYAEIEQRCLIVESEKRKISDLEKLRKKKGAPAADS